MRDWNWHSNTVLLDLWAWVHCIHAILALAKWFNHGILFLIMSRNLQKGKIWIGDALASISNTLLCRGAFVLLSWHLNEFWTISELCLADGYDLVGIQKLAFFPEIGHADFLTLFLTAVDILGYLMKERIDPTFVTLIFELGFALRVQISGIVLTVLRDCIINYSTSNFEKGLQSGSELLQEVTPLRLRNIHALKGSSVLFRVASSLPNSSLTFGCAVCYVLARKLYRKRCAIPTSNAQYVPNGEQQQQTKKTMTFFETATGAELQNRFGVIGDYDNFVFLKGMKFASADGIYCNGFVIANGKFLVATEDIRAIILMKLLRTRLRNVYTYEVDGSKLKQTAQLVYPHTLSWADLLHLNVGILS
ncbi:hypothetical protein Gpo141_00004127 [Globisporangium polare]